MRILKYLLLLLLLFAIGAAVFVATQPGQFRVEVSREVAVSRNVSYIFINDYRNWPLWFVPAETAAFDGATSGVGASFHWDGSEGSGSALTTLSTENDSISQKIRWNGLPGTMTWKLSDAGNKGTRLTLSATGKLGFMDKIRTTLSGGPQQMMTTLLENSLEKLASSLVRETGTFAISAATETWKKSTFYVKQSITSTLENLPRNRRVMRTNLMRFFTKNDMRAYGRPFVEFHYYDPEKKLAKFSVCVPVRKSVYIMPGSDVQSGRLDAFKAVKVTLTGDYSHLPDAYTKAVSYIREHHLQRLGSRALEIYSVSKESGKSPSHWVTDLYIPVAEAPAAKPVTPVPVNPPASRPAAESQTATDVGEIPIP